MGVSDSAQTVASSRARSTQVMLASTAAVRTAKTQVNNVITTYGGPDVAESEPHIRSSGTDCCPPSGPEAGHGNLLTG